MKKIMNRPEDVVTQLLNGLSFSYSDILERVPSTGIIIRKYQAEDQVAIVSGGGTGHEPAHSGYVGKNMLSASINGPIFVPPTVDDILRAIKLSDNGQGVLLIIKNFDADVKNFLTAEMIAREEGKKVDHVIVNDDCSIDKDSFKKRRRGVAGTIFVHKIISAAAVDGLSLEKLVLLGEEVVQSLNTLGVALSPGTIPGGKVAQFELEETDISFGIGIHGEVGYRREPIESSEKLANELINKLKCQYDFNSTSKIAILINDLGSTPLMELGIFANDVRRLLELERIEVVFKKVGHYMTSLNMAGISLTFLEIRDKKWLDYLKLSVETYAW